MLSETGELEMAQSDNIGHLTNTFDICQFQIKLKCQEDKCSFTFYLHSSVCLMRSLSDHKTYLQRCGEIKLEWKETFVAMRLEDFLGSSIL